MAFTKKADKKKPPRAKGEGSIFQRADGMWVGSIEVRTDTGQRKQRRVYSKDYRALVAKLDELKTDYTDGVTLDRTITVAKWLDYWLPNIHKERIRPSTFRDYGYTVNNIAKTIGHKKLVELTPADVRRMCSMIGKGERRAQKAHVVLHKALKDAVAEGIVKRNVADVADAPDVADPERLALPISDAQKVLAFSAENRSVMEHARWLLAAMTGARQGEVLGLTWDRVDLQRGTADITWQLQQIKRAHGCGEKNGDKWPCGHRYGGHCDNPLWDVPVKFEYKPLHASLALTRPKSAAGKRRIQLNRDVRDALVALRASDIGANPHGLVFHRLDGRPVIPSEDGEAWHKLLRDAGVIGADETFPMHGLRRTAATVLRSGGVDEQTRMEILGHNSPEVTRIYAQIDEERNATVMELLSVLMPKELP